MIYALLVLIVTDIMNYRKIKIRKVILEQEGWFQSVVFAGTTLFILLYGIWGAGYDSANFIYFQF
jgi:hypothetical protein